MRKPACALVVVVTLIMICTFAYGADAPGPIPPIPEKFKNIQIIKPDSSIPKDLTDFSGEWEGFCKYVGAMCPGLSHGQHVRRVKLIIYEVSADKVKFLYGCGENPNSSSPGGWSNNNSEIHDDGGRKAFLRMPGSGFKMKFYLENGQLLGSQGGNYSFELKRIK